MSCCGWCRAARDAAPYWRSGFRLAILAGAIFYLALALLILWRTR